MRRKTKFGVYLTAAMFLGPATFLGALAQDDSQPPEEVILRDAVATANTLLAAELITGEEYQSTVCAAEQVAISDGMLAAEALAIGNISECEVTETTENSETTDSGGKAPVTPIVIPKTTASGNDSTSPAID